MNPLINTKVEPWRVTVAGIGCVDIASDGTTLIADCLDNSAERILREHVGAPLAAWRRGNWLANAALMRTPAGSNILVNSSLESWYPAFGAMLERGWTYIADRPVEITATDGRVCAASHNTGATVPERLAESLDLVIAHHARPGSDSVELEPTVAPGHHQVSALVILENRVGSAPETGVVRARAIRDMLAMPELRPTACLGEIVSSLSSLPFQRFPSIFQPALGDTRDINARARDTVALVDEWMHEGSP
jgi:hypothetical protein